MRMPSAIALSVLVHINSVSAQPLEDSLQKIPYPETERVDVAEQHFGQTIVDSYRWLENDAPDDQAVAAWISAQNELTQSHLEKLPGRSVFQQRLKDLFDYERYTVPHKRGDRYFFTLNKGLDDQSSLYVREGVSGDNRLLIDPNAWSEDKGDALSEWDVSDDGRFMAYSIIKGGTDRRTIKVLDVDSGKELGDFIEWARFTRVTWAPDGSGFFYSRVPKPAEGATAGAVVANHAVYFHKLGTPQSDDRLIYSTPENPRLLHGAVRVFGERYLSIASTPGTNESALTIIDLASQDWKPRTVVAGMDAAWTVLGHDGSKLILATTRDAKRGRIVSLDLAEADPKPVEIVAEAADKAVLNHATVAGGRLLLSYQIDVKTEIRRFALDGKPEGTIALPGIGTAGLFQGSARDNEAFFAFTSYDTPTSIYRYDVSSNATTPWAEPKVPMDLDKISVEQRFYRSKDGTEVPMFIVRRKDVTGPAPTVLHGYGGFGISQIPIFNPLQLAWVEQGGVLAVANIRGGSEYGTEWHRAAQLDKRQNAFDDFIASAEFLKRTGITPADGLAIQGESGGGLLVGAVANQRPELFDVALPGVGVMDMLRYEKFTGGALWSGEYGSPTEERHFRNLMTYSPYHTIRQGADYPAILATTADADDRVVPAHTFKYVAALQAADLGQKPHLVRIETNAGHGGGMSLDRVIAQRADMWAFAAHWTGLKIQPAK